jgi:hypothetical protein
MHIRLPLLVSSLLLALPTASYALDDSARDLMSEALVHGSAQMPLDADGMFGRAVTAIRASTNDAGPVVLYTQRLQMFKDQPRCGRVLFVVGQPSAHQVWPELGGQLNICENGDPPQRVCRNAPGKLVLANARCSDGTTPIDTPEVKQAIDAAVAAGSMKPEDAAKLMQQPSNRPARR